MSAKTRTQPKSAASWPVSGFGAILLLMWSLFAPQNLRGQETAVLEEQVKAAFLYNFVRFVEWPSSAFATETTPITVGVVGNEPFANTLSTSLKEKKAHGRGFIVKKLAAPTEAVGCQVVFIAKDESRKNAQFAEATRKQPILLIGETDDVLEVGGIIYLLRDDKQLRFDINVTAAEQAKLTVSSHLLRLARKTKKGEASK